MQLKMLNQIEGNKINKNLRCWRLIGGVLVERKLDEVSASLKESLELLEKTG